MDKARILMVDDDPMILKFVTANLKVRGFDVTAADDGQSALEAVDRTCPDLVVLDLLLPDMNGSEVCRRIRQFSDVPIIVLTAIGESNTKWELLDLGASDFMTKPFDIADLLARIRTLLDQRSASG